MQLVRRKREVVWGGAPLVGTAAGIVILYFTWPAAESGAPFFSLAGAAGTRDLHEIYVIVWMAFALVLSFVGVLMARRAISSSTRSLASGGLLGLGLSIGHMWLGGLLVGTTLFAGGEERSQPPSPAFLMALLGWACVVVAIVLIVRQPAEHPLDTGKESSEQQA